MNSYLSDEEKEINRRIESGEIRPAHISPGARLIGMLNRINLDLRSVTINKEHSEKALELLKIIEDHVKIVTRP